jgi:hypothetical protein
VSSLEVEATQTEEVPVTGTVPYLLSTKQAMSAFTVTTDHYWYAGTYLVVEYGTLRNKEGQFAG